MDQEIEGVCRSMCPVCVDTSTVAVARIAVKDGGGGRPSF